MNSNKLGPLLVGALIGAGIGYLAADWYIETHIPEEGFELRSQIEKFEERKSKAVLHTQNMNRVANGLTPVPAREAINYTQRFVGSERPDLAKLAAKYNLGIEESVDEPIDDGAEEFLEEIGHADPELDTDDEEDILDDTDDPCIISMETFAEDLEHTHTTLTYYTDDVLCDEAGVPINRPGSFLPEDTFISFGKGSHDEDVVYVRNSKKKAMYEIVRVDTAYMAPVKTRIRRHSELKEKTSEGADD